MQYKELNMSGQCGHAYCSLSARTCWQECQSRKEQLSNTLVLLVVDVSNRIDNHMDPLPFWWLQITSSVPP